MQTRVEAQLCRHSCHCLFVVVSDAAFSFGSTDDGILILRVQLSKNWSPLENKTSQSVFKLLF